MKVKSEGDSRNNIRLFCPTCRTFVGEEIDPNIWNDMKFTYRQNVDTERKEILKKACVSREPIGVKVIDSPKYFADFR